MNPSSAPGPDGVGPGFYKAAWSDVRADVMAFLQAVHARTADLQRINRAHIVLIPKCPGAAPSAFRLVSLQNCPLKILTKILTARMQGQVQKLVDVDQTGFLKGRSISENFVYATELIQCCYQRKAPTLVLKLDFAKAFDSVDWDALMNMLMARGFPSLWCDWMKELLQTSKSAVLVNGCPGPWINCKRGLRQGDPLYLFILVAGVLQTIIKRAGSVIRHPLTDSACPVLQYADDTLLVLRAKTEDVVQLKTCLDDFAMATGLKINYHKSTAVPMHVPAQELEEMIAALGCQQGTFPQTYLGLPLSNTKLRLSAFAPMIAKVDKYLAGWKATLLSLTGRVVLINAVLDGLPTYAMGALLLPPGVRDKLDAKRRAFLWNGSDKTTGAKCLVAWEDVCKEKEDGGLGIKRLDTQNSCLLLKLLHRLKPPGRIVVGGLG